ncbi:MAG: hypothetical protein NC310_08825 [Roseburia sp.]|nr:hypothetical protein [Roseburia sp.]
MEEAFRQFLQKQKLADNTIRDYVYWVKRVMKREELTDWWFLAAKINVVYVKYERGGEEAEFGEKGNRSCINGLKKFKEYFNQMPSEIRAIINKLN